MNWAYSIDEIAVMAGAAPLGRADRISRVCTDSRKAQPGDLFVAIPGERFDGAAFVPDAFARGAVAALTTREDAAGPCIVVEDPVIALQRFARHHRLRFNVPVLGITGSCGKTSTKEFTAALLETRFRVTRTLGNLNNEIGCPLSLLEMTDETGFAVIEMGAGRIGDIAHLCRVARPTESAITMVGPAHLEKMGSIERVAAAKSEIASGLGPSGVFYVNTADPWCLRIGEQYRGEKVYFGTEGSVRLLRAEFNDQGLLVMDVDPVGRLTLPLPILAQASNVLLAIAVALRHGVTDFEAPLAEACRNSIRFRWENIRGIHILDDSYNANPASTRAAIEAIARRPGAGARMAALGTMLELGDETERLHEEVGEYAAQQGLTHLFGRGPLAYAMIRAARAAGIPHAEVIDDHAAIASAILSAASSGDVLLIKGSRGMRMEGVLAALRELAAPSPLMSPEEHA